MDERLFFVLGSQKQILPNPSFTQEGIKAPPFAKGGWEGFSFDLKLIDF